MTIDEAKQNLNKRCLFSVDPEVTILRNAAHADLIFSKEHFSECRIIEVSPSGTYVLLGPSETSQREEWIGWRLTEGVRLVELLDGPSDAMLKVA